jgi:ABC-type transport system involved in multi-copper enzyme maturation permease subunit
MNRAAPIFSPFRITAMALNTLTELTRMKVFYFLLIFALVNIGLSFFAADLKTEEQFQLLKDVALGTMSIVTSLIAILATALLLPKDLEDRTTFTILAKPVPRYEYIAGKLLGIILLLAIAIAAMAALFLVVLWLRERTILSALAAMKLSPEDLAVGIASVKAVTFNINLLPGILIIFVAASLLASLTLMISTFATSAIFTMMITIAIYFIGHLQATARGYWLDPMGVQWWTKPFLAIVALLFPDLQAFSLTDDIVAGVQIHWGLFAQTAALGVFYVAVYYSIACFLFSNREL